VAILNRTEKKLSVQSLVDSVLVVDGLIYRLILVDISFQRTRLSDSTLQEFSEFINCPIRTCIGFIDGTVRGFYRPSYAQKEFYNGHKRKNALKYQSVIGLDGIILDLLGPISGRLHDLYMLNQSHVVETLREQFAGMFLYGDTAYPLTDVLIRGFKTLRTEA
jgi:Na+-transporting NADH:ubiquinone oxidoreductase subunit NqrD